MPIERLLDGVRRGAALLEILAEPGHGPISVVERQVFGAGNAKAVVPPASMPIRARHHQSMQHREIDRSLHAKAEASTPQEPVDHLGAAGLAPQAAKHQIRANAHPLQFGQLAAIEARQYDRTPRVPRGRSHQRIEHPGGLDLIAATQRLDHALDVPPALTGILDEIKILVGPNLLDPDEHRGAPWRSPQRHHKVRFGQAKTPNQHKSFSTTKSADIQKSSICGLLAQLNERNLRSWA